MGKQPKQLVNSSYDRNPDDKYYTEGWLVDILTRRLSMRRFQRICDPAAGRGDILRQIADSYPGVDLVGSDIKPDERRVFNPIRKADFLADDYVFDANVDCIITNPPFGDLAQQFVEKTLATPHMKLAAFLLRCNWNTASGGRGKTKGSRIKLFEGRGGMPFAYEIIITDRPRWDWWYKTEEESAKDNKPFHSYSWYVWAKDWEGPSTQFWEGREENFL